MAGFAHPVKANERRSLCHLAAGHFPCNPTIHKLVDMSLAAETLLGAGHVGGSKSPVPNDDVPPSLSYLQGVKSPTQIFLRLHIRESPNTVGTAARSQLIDFGQERTDYGYSDQPV